MRNWLLPEYIEDVLPAEAARVEQLRRSLLDLFKVHGYLYVIPPMMEYMESLTTGIGHDLDIATFKVVDQLTGKLMGIRADITPQTARIDAHMLNNQGVTRLCYAGSVLRTSPDGLARSREPLHVGAELYGHAGVESDIEIQRLMIKALHTVGLDTLYIDVSHVGIFASLLEHAGIGEAQEQELYAALQSKDQAAVRALGRGLNPDTLEALSSLTELSGDISVLEQAAKRLPQTEKIQQALRDLKAVGAGLDDLDVKVCFDLAELRGYHYHSGIVFAAYAQGYAGPLARGGRYDEVGAIFGRARPATGFSLDLRGVVSSLPVAETVGAIFAPAIADDALIFVVESLRAQGQVVIQDLPGQEPYRAELGCDRILVQQNGEWVVVAAPEL
ncbi:ATP phosphoribosyltransferase regulatory subunit [Methylobacillus flagellatus]|uniref:ATP phosphoribosyltransferase regulatory subunit n=1 Tax=Methylobacillus flagellatus (strain ATCC 51484 / DSM 6875 / VKM B-1610 / KT) TaxID=265072 RepID=HISZ_METFK|nr:ATP phosphoribosyltransferase regulatory subunit [Methylobacillus flagellatus]Q1H0Y5.1 RecName: Full=ATP phosphoribosyltransferase regulatory subunit [Methylobacillus flagellatus KT]ABE49852.1 tRNA synthetase, class II (G, H, P and S) [Methylobacillus flagellatus KT]